MRRADGGTHHTAESDPSATSLLRLIRTFRVDNGATRRPTVFAVDGRSGSGKSTIARRLAGVDASVSVVSTDDLAWNESFFGWSDIAAEGILEPLRRGALPLDYRPPAWELFGRDGYINVPGHTTVVLFEGVGSSRRDLAHMIDGALWVDADDNACAERLRLRGGSDGHPESQSFVDAWSAEEHRFLAHDRPSTRATIVVRSCSGSPGGPLAFVRK